MSEVDPDERDEYGMTEEEYWRAFDEWLEMTNEQRAEAGLLQSGDGECLR